MIHKIKHLPNKIEDERVNKKLGKGQRCFFLCKSNFDHSCDRNGKKYYDFLSTMKGCVV